MEDSDIESEDSSIVKWSGQEGRIVRMKSVCVCVWGGGSRYTEEEG